MSVRTKKRAAPLNEETIDRLVTLEAEDESALRVPVRVKRSKPASVSIPGGLAARTRCLAKLHHEPDVGRWIERIVRERVEKEERAFTKAKEELAL